jgi:hypothetical protein
VETARKMGFIISETHRNRDNNNSRESQEDLEIKPIDLFKSLTESFGKDGKPNLKKLVYNIVFEDLQFTA